VVHVNGPIPVDIILGVFCCGSAFGTLLRHQKNEYSGSQGAWTAGDRVDVDTQEFMALRGELNGLSVRVAELAHRQVDLDVDQAAAWFRLRHLDEGIRAGLDLIEAKLDGKLTSPIRPALKVIEGGRRPAGRHRRARLAVVPGGGR
jgi:hypothetical protein